MLSTHSWMRQPLELRAEWLRCCGCPLRGASSLGGSGLYCSSRSRPPAPGQQKGEPTSRHGTARHGWSTRAAPSFFAEKGTTLNKEPAEEPVGAATEPASYGSGDKVPRPGGLPEGPAYSLHRKPWPHQPATSRLLLHALCPPLLRHTVLSPPVLVDSHLPSPTDASHVGPVVLDPDLIFSPRGEH